MQKFDHTPNPAVIGLSHEAWLDRELKTKSPVSRHWLSQLTPFSLVNLEVDKPKSRLDKSNLDLSITVKDASGQQMFLQHQVSAKAGSSALPGHAFSTSLATLPSYGIFPEISADPLLHQLHSRWLEQKQPLSSFSAEEQAHLLEWYRQNWVKLQEFALFGGSAHPDPDKNTQATCLLLTELAHDAGHNMYALRTALIQKAQVLLDLQMLSPASQLSLLTIGENPADKHNQTLGKIVSGPFSISRDGGKKGKKSASNWKVRFGRQAYLEWLLQNRPSAVFTC